MKNTFRYIAKITLEAASAFAVNSGKEGLIHDNMVVKDANGLPYLPGTSLTGVLRHAFTKKNEKLANRIFGEGGSKGEGSLLAVSAGLLIGSDGKQVHEQLQTVDFNDAFYQAFKQSPYRDHVKINEKGVAEKGQKFEEELVYKGARFVFEIELMGNAEDRHAWGSILSLVGSPDFRLGSGSRNGQGVFKAVSPECFQMELDLSTEEGLRIYLEKSSSLNQAHSFWKPLKIEDDSDHKDWIKYELKLKPKDFFLFGAGHGDEDVDHITKREKFFIWDGGKPLLTEKDQILIPATSIKGALRHRLAYHYNKKIKSFIGKEEDLPDPNVKFDLTSLLEDFEKNIGLDRLTVETTLEKFDEIKSQIEAFDFEGSESWQQFETKLAEEKAGIKSKLTVTPENEAENMLFGNANDSKQDTKGKRGSVLLEDHYIPYAADKEKIFNHVKIDRFTGGAVAGALFQEKAYYAPSEIPMTIWVERSALEDTEIKEAFEATLNDLIAGRMPLGGMTTKGHGFLKGL